MDLSCNLTFIFYSVCLCQEIRQRGFCPESCRNSPKREGEFWSSRGLQTFGISGPHIKYRNTDEN